MPAGHGPLVVQVRDAHRHPEVGLLLQTLEQVRSVVVLEWGWPGPYDGRSARICTRGSSLPAVAAVRDAAPLGRMGPMTAGIGLDIGATKTLGVVVDAQGRIQASVRRPTIPGADGVLSTAADVVSALRREVGSADGPVGVGMPGWWMSAPVPSSTP